MRSEAVALTTGEPAGIGPDLCALLRRESFSFPIVLLGDRDMLEKRMGFSLPAYRQGESVPLSLCHIPLCCEATAGRLDPANSRYVLNVIDRAASGCLAGEFAAMVTAPVHKGIINEAGIHFSGHTEYLAEIGRCEKVVMMLVGGGMRVALATTHLPLKDVPASITGESLEATLRILARELVRSFGIMAPKILVAGLNPHAGEGGHLGREEIEIIIPVLEKLRREGMQLEGPLPADTLFNPDRLQGADAVLAMYHDQGLPVLKHASFGEGVNVTLGLPFIRTSVDHGTAIELAGGNQAKGGSLMAALGLAHEIASNR